MTHKNRQIQIKRTNIPFSFKIYIFRIFFIVKTYQLFFKRYFRNFR